MNVSYLISELEQLKEKHGDLDVLLRIYNRDTWDWDSENIAEISVEVDNGKKIVSISE